MKNISRLKGDASRPLEVVELPSFSRSAQKLFGRDELNEIVYQIACWRELGDVIPQTGGLRKMRVDMEGRGKSRGARIIYLYGGDHMPIFLLAAYDKSAQPDLRPHEKRLMRDYVKAIRNEYGNREVSQSYSGGSHGETAHSRRRRDHRGS